MSGGHYDYAYGRIRDCADAIADDAKLYTTEHVDRYGFTYAALPPDILALMHKAAATLRLAERMAHDIEWYMSGDYGDDTLRRCAAEWGQDVVTEK